MQVRRQDDGEFSAVSVKEPVFTFCGSGNSMPRPGSVEAADMMVRERIAVCRGGKKGMHRFIQSGS